MAEPLGELAPVYRKLPIYYITNRMTVRGPGTTVVNGRATARSWIMNSNSAS